jgi:hypothetical protein
LKAPARTAWTRVFTAQFFQQIFVAMDRPKAGFHLGLGRKSFAALATALERRIGWYWLNVA